MYGLYLLWGSLSVALNVVSESKEVVVQCTIKQSFSGMHGESTMRSVLNHIRLKVVDDVSRIKISFNSQNKIYIKNIIIKEHLWCGYTRSWAASIKFLSMASSKGFFLPRLTSHAPHENRVMKQSM